MITIFEYYRQMQQEVKQSASKSTCLIVREKEEKPEAFGSGVLLKVDDWYMLVTAAHVIERVAPTPLVPIPESRDYVPLNGRHFNNIPALNREDDPIDISVIVLDDATRDALLPYYVFITQNELGINHTTVTTNSYTAIGYPETKSRVKFGRMKSRPLWFSGTVTSVDALFTKAKRRKETHLLMGYNRNKLINLLTHQRWNGPKPYGMSGGGIWFTPPEPPMPGKAVKKLLVGILTETSPELDHKYWVATRIDILTECLRQTLSARLPKSLIPINCRLVQDSKADISYGCHSL